MIAYFIAHRGPAPHFFSEHMYAAVSSSNGLDDFVASLDDVCDSDYKQQIEQVLAWFNAAYSIEFVYVTKWYYE